MFCSRHGKELHDGAKFCGSCGNKVNQKAPTGTKILPQAADLQKRSETKEFGKRVVIAVTVCVLAVAVTAVGVVSQKYIERNSSADAVAVANFEEVNNTLIELAESDEYDEAETGTKMEQMLELLYQLENKGKIAPNSVEYDKSTQMIYYEYADGAYGGVMLEDFADDSFGYVGADSYVAEYNADGLPLESAETITLGVDSYPYEEKDLSALVMVGVGDEWPQRTEEFQQRKWNGAYLQTEINIDATVAGYRNELRGYDLILIREHGFIYQNNPTISLSETAAITFYQSTSAENVISAKDMAYIDDLNAHRIGMYLSISDRQYHYFLLPEFFTYYYGDNQLKNAIIWISCCDGYMNDTLVTAFADCGAKAVLGCTEAVKGGYEFCMSDAFVYMLLYGNTVEESLSFAKSIWGENDSIFWSNYNPKQNEDTDSSEFRCYTGGNKTLVTLTKEATAVLKSVGYGDTGEESNYILDILTSSAWDSSWQTVEYMFFSRDGHGLCISGALRGNLGTPMEFTYTIENGVVKFASNEEFFILVDWIWNEELQLFTRSLTDCGEVYIQEIASILPQEVFDRMASVDSGDIYDENYWEGLLNHLLLYYKLVLSTEDYNVLQKEQKEWQVKANQEISDKGLYANADSMLPWVQHYYKERIYELLGLPFDDSEPIINENFQPEAIIDYETAVALILDYFNGLEPDDGTYVVFDTESIESDTNYLIIVRYQKSDREAEILISEGIIPSANLLIASVIVDKATGIFRLENGAILNISIN